MREMNLEQNIIHSVLTDDLSRAKSLLEQGEFPLLAELMDRAHEKALPLSHLKSEAPDFVVFFPAYTCGVGCKMCCTGFSSSTQLYEDYLYMSPD